MTVTISLSPEKEKVLRERASASGQDVTAYVQQPIEKELQAPRTLDEILAPFRRQVEESGMTEEELDTFFEEARDEVWQEKQAQQGKTE